MVLDMDIRLRKYKKDQNHSYSLGVYPTLELLKYKPEHVLGVLIHSKGDRNRGIHKILYACTQNEIDCITDDRRIERLVNKENVYAVGIFRKYRSTIDPHENHMILVNPNSMGNIGSIFRTMVGFGLINLALILPAADIFDPKVIRSSMGAIFQLNIEEYKYINAYKDRHLQNLYTFISTGGTNIDIVIFKSPYALIFGNESRGLPFDYNNIGTSVTIPHSHKIDSLNLSVAVGIAIYCSTSREINKAQ